MKLLEYIAHWAFAIFMAIVSYVVLLVVFAYLILKLEGLQFGAPMPADFQSRADPMLLGLVVRCAAMVPLMAAAYFGTITTPYSQRRVASVIFPTMTFLTINLLSSFAKNGHNPGVVYLLETGAGCAAVGAWLYFRWGRHHSQAARRK
jgi:hypothetical protein